MPRWLPLHHHLDAPTIALCHDGLMEQHFTLESHGMTLEKGEKSLTQAKTLWFHADRWLLSRQACQDSLGLCLAEARLLFLD